MAVEPHTHKQVLDYRLRELIDRHRTGAGDDPHVNIVGAIITGSTFRTAATGARVEITQSEKDRIAFYGGSAGVFLGAIGAFGPNTTAEILDINSKSVRIRKDLFSPSAGHEWAGLQAGQTDITRPYNSGTKIVDFNEQQTNGAFVKIGGIRDANGGIAIDGIKDTLRLASDTMLDLRNTAGSAAGSVFTLGATPAHLVIENTGAGVGSIRLRSSVEIQAQDRAGTGWIPMRASAFTVQSDSSLKTDIQPLDVDTRAAIAAIADAARRGRFKNRPVDSPLQTMLVANDLPELVRADLPAEHDDDGNEIEPALAGYDLSAVAVVNAVETSRLGALVDWLLANAALKPGAKPRPTGTSA